MFSGRKCETTLAYGAYNKTLEVILRDTYVLHMLLMLAVIFPAEVSASDETRRKK